MLCLCGGRQYDAFTINDANDRSIRNKMSNPITIAMVALKGKISDTAEDACKAKLIHERKYSTATCIHPTIVRVALEMRVAGCLNTIASNLERYKLGPFKILGSVRDTRAVSIDHANNTALKIPVWAIIEHETDIVSIGGLYTIPKDHIDDSVLDEVIMEVHSTEAPNLMQNVTKLTKIMRPNIDYPLTCTKKCCNDTA